MTLTSDRVFEALVSEDDIAAGLEGDGAWVERLSVAELLTPESLGASPNVVDALMYPNETAACLSQLIPSAELLPALDLLTPAMLELDGQLDALVAVERHIGLLQARSAELLTALEVTAAGSKDGFTRDHVAGRVAAAAGVDARPDG